MMFRIIKHFIILYNCFEALFFKLCKVYKTEDEILYGQNR